MIIKSLHLATLLRYIHARVRVFAIPYIFRHRHLDAMSLMGISSRLL